MLYCVTEASRTEASLAVTSRLQLSIGYSKSMGLYKEKKQRYLSNNHIFNNCFKGLSIVWLKYRKGDIFMHSA